MTTKEGKKVVKVMLEIMIVGFCLAGDQQFMFSHPEILIKIGFPIFISISEIHARIYRHKEFPDFLSCYFGQRRS